MMSPKTIASTGQACWQAVWIVPSGTTTSSGWPSWARFTFHCDLRLLDPLHAVRALLHDAAHADRDVGVLHHLARAPGMPLGPERAQVEAVQLAHVPIEEVEAAHLVRAVVRAVPGADAAVVRHDVEPLGVVHGGVDRADRLARRLLALHAGDRLHRDLRVLGDLAVARAAERLRRRPCRRSSSGRAGSSAYRGRGAPAPCRRSGCCSRPGRRRRRRCSRCRC